MNPLKEACAKFIEGQPGAIDYFGKDKLESWANDAIASSEFDQLFSWYQMGNFKDIQGFIANHAQGVTAPAPTGFEGEVKVEDYDSIISFLQQDLDNETAAIQTAEDNIAKGVMGNNIGVLRKAIAYYQAKKAEADKNIAPGQ